MPSFYWASHPLSLHFSSFCYLDSIVCSSNYFFLPIFLKSFGPAFLGWLHLAYYYFWLNYNLPFIAGRNTVEKMQV